jgi:cysteine-rich repeat protein
MKWWLLAVVLCGACVEVSSVSCPDGRVCPEGRLCAEVKPTDAAHADASPDKLCIAPEQLTACDGKDSLAECEIADFAAGRCYDGVCLPSGCGNARVDPDEACDDANTVIGDSCSFSCQSDETCGNGYVDPVDVDDMGVPHPAELCDDSGRFGHDGCSGTCQPEHPDWGQIGLGSPVGRYGAAMGYDAYRGRMVLFGGASGNGATQYADTWQYDGTSWVQIPTVVKPSPRYSASMVFDPIRKRLLMYGGFSTGDGIDELWELDGEAWKQVFPTSGVRPPGRGHAGVVYDSKRDRLVIFGGATEPTTFSAGHVLGDTWEWNGSTWTEITSAGPPLRWGHVMVFDPVRGVSVMAGGYNTSPGSSPPVLQGTWEYDGAWTMKSGSNPTEFILADGAYDPISKTPIVYGGEGGGYSNNTYSWNGSAWTAMGGSTVASGRYDMMLATDWRRGRVVMFGGITSGAMGVKETWERAAPGWVQVAPATPGPLMLFASAYDPTRHRVVVFGGATVVFGAPVGNTWLFDGVRWSPGGSGPSGRWLPAMATDTKRHRVILFGGYASAIMGDTWIWNGTSWASVASSAPPGRWAHAMAYDEKRDRIVMFGGTPTGGGDLGDTWEWDGTTWTDKTPTDAADSPSPRNGHAMAYDPLRERVVLVGGTAIDHATWEWDGTKWSAAVSISTLPLRNGMGLAWNYSRGSLVMFSGRSALGDAWERIGTEWAPIPVTTEPVGRVWGGFFPNPDGSGVMSYGGWDENGSTTGLADMWHLDWTNLDSYEACAGDGDEDGDGLVTCADPDCWARCTPSCPPGAACDTAAPHCGDGVCAPGIEDCRICPGDCMCTPACGDGVCDPGETAAMCPGDC